jgi:hypothetical protein
MKTTQCGLPTLTAVADTFVPSDSSSGIATASRSGPVMGICVERNVACPISTVTKFTRPSLTWQAH